MSITEINNSTYDYLPTEIKVKRSSYLNNNPNASTISRKKLDSMVYGTGVDDYMFNEIKKAKYQGCFDPGSVGNKNMFNDSYNYKINTTVTTSKTNDLKKTFDKTKKLTRYTTSSNLHSHDEGKNLLIAKSETQYPYEFDRRHCVLSKKYNFRKNLNNLDYCFSSSLLNSTEKNRRMVDSIKNKNLSYSSSNYYTPSYNEKKYRLQIAGNKYKNKTLMMNSLMNNYYNSSKIMNYSRFHNFSNNKNSCSKLLLNNKNVCFSPIIKSKKCLEYDSNTNYKYGNKINKNIYKSLNDSRERNNDNNILFFSQMNEYDNNNFKSNETEFDNETLKYRLGKELKTYDDTEIGNEIDNDNDKDNNLKLINKYMSKIVSLFLVHMSNFYLLHFRDIFRTFISQLKKCLKNNDYRFENKTIKNIALIKKKLKSNPFYYGHSKQFQNLLKEGNKTNSKNTNKTKINTTKKANINNLKEEDIQRNLIRKRYVADNKKYIDKNSEIINQKKYNINKNAGQKKLKVEIINKKYVKKKVSQRIIENSGLPKIIDQHNDKIKTNTELLSSDYFNEHNQNEIKKLFKSFDENEIINDDEFISTPNMDKKLTTAKNFGKAPKNKTKVKTLLFKKTTVPNPCKMSQNITLKKNRRKLNIPKDNIDKKNIQIYGASNILSQDEKLNMNMRYLEMDNNNLTLNPINNKNNKNFEVENNFTHTIIGKLKSKNDIGNDDNSENNDDDEIDTFSNKNLQNAISIITKIMESKEKQTNKSNDKDINKDNDKDQDKINTLLKRIFENKEKKNVEILKKYFNKFKSNNFRTDKKSFKKKKKYSLDIGENTDLNKVKNNLIESKVYQNESSERNKKERKSMNDIETLKENATPNRRGSKFKVVIKKLKIHKSITKNIFNPKIRIRTSKKSIPSLTEINTTPSRGSLNKINSLIIDMNKNNLFKDKDNDENKPNIEKAKKDEKKVEESKSSIESDQSSENSNLNINNEMSKKNIDTNSDKNLRRNIKIISKKINNKDKRKSFAIPNKRSSIEMFTKYIKNKAKLNLSNESMHDGDITLNEKFQDYENLIFYLRTQLIYCFIGNKKVYDSCAD